MIDKVDALNKKMQRLAVALNVKSTSNTSSSPSTKEDKVFINHVQSYVKTAETIVSRATSSNTSNSNATLVSPGAKTPLTNISPNFAVSSAPRSLPSENRRQIESWIPSTNPRVPSVRNFSNSGVATKIQQNTSTQSNIEDIDLELQLSLQYLQNGHKKYDAGDYAGAESCYRKVSVKLVANNFHEQIALHSEDLQLRIASTCFKQRKWEDAKSVLTPLTVWKTAHDRLVAFAANRLLAEVFYQIKDYQKAEAYALTAVKGRKKYLGGKHALFFESVSLLVAIYQANGDEAEAEAWQAILATNKSTLPPYTPDLPPYQPKELLIEDESPAGNPGDLPHLFDRLRFLQRPTPYDDGLWDDLPEQDVFKKYEEYEAQEKFFPLYAQALRHVLGEPPSLDPVSMVSRKVVGAIFVLLGPLPVEYLATLLSLPKETVQSVYQTMPKIIEYESGEERVIRPVRMQPSFKAYLVKKPTVGNYLSWHEWETGIQCLKCMSALLGSVCKLLPESSLIKSDDEREEIARWISPHLQYACRYWVHHLHEGRTHHRVGHNDVVLRFFKEYLLHWLEIMGILDSITDALAMIIVLKADLMQYVSCSHENPQSNAIHQIL
jgi:hypothetical protein